MRRKKSPLHLDPFGFMIISFWPYHGVVSVVKSFLNDKFFIEKGNYFFKGLKFVILVECHFDAVVVAHNVRIKWSSNSLPISATMWRNFKSCGTAVQNGIPC